MLAKLFRVLSDEDIDALIKFIEKNKHTTEIGITSPVSDLLRATIRQNDSAMFDILLKYNLDIDAFPTNGSPALIAASYIGLPYFVEKLLQKGANILLCDEDNDTALSACLNESLTDGRIKCARLLIKVGFDIEYLNNPTSNQAYQIALLLKENELFLSKSQTVVESPERLRISSVSAKHLPEAEHLPNTILKSPFDNPILIRAIIANQGMKTQEKFAYQSFNRFSSSDSNYVVNNIPQMKIELPLYGSGEKIMGHILLPGMKLQHGNTVGNKPVIGRFSETIHVSDIDGGKLEKWAPYEMYY
ncbi:MAG TPA: ankyrin repeat domain-containing protein [Aquella sp.]|nr:ankyrin repeat domain-containing protein [Aquella sp.]